MLRRLVEADVRFVVIGGLAMRAHGSARLTEDLDVCYDPEPANVAKLAAVLASWHGYLRGVEPGLPFVMDEQTFQTTPVMTLVTDHGAIDVMDRVQGVGDYSDVVAASVDVRVDDLRFRALDLPGLIAAKRSVGRPKDRDQIPELEALLAMRKRAGRKK